MARSNVVRVAIIGAGAISTKVHIPCYLSNDNARVVALVDPDVTVAKKVAKKFGIESYFPSTKELFEHSKVDVLSVCTPPNTHAEIVQEALEQNLDVLCEKPLAENFEAGKKIYDTAVASENFVMVGFNRRFHSDYLKVRKIAKSGKAGHVYLVEYSSLQGSPLLGWTKSNWQYTEGVGGCLNDQGSHVFDILNWFLGDPISAVASFSTNSDSSVDESCVAAVEYDKSIDIGIMSWLNAVRIENLTVHGTGRSIYVSPSPNFFLDLNPSDLPNLSVWKSASRTLSKTIRGAFLPTGTDIYQKEIDYFIQCVRKRTKPFLDVAAGLKALAVTDAVKRSIEHKAKIQVASVS